MRVSAVRAVVVLSLVAIAGCETIRLPETSTPVVSETPPAPPPAAEDVAAPDDSLARFYASVEDGLTASGRMRRDTAPADIPWGVPELVHNFERIALYDEYVEIGGRFVRRAMPATLRRWERPVRVGLLFGESIPEAVKAADRAYVENFTSRLAELTGLDMTMAGADDTNFLVLFLNREEQERFADRAALRLPGFEPSVMRAIRATPIDTFCTAYAFSEPEDPDRYAAVLVLVKAEHPELTRHSCIEEEMAQAMGLPNDYDGARPSLFNDSLEFAFLTTHDEVLLRMLYDPRLEPGMTAAEARPLLPAIAEDAMRAHGLTVAGGV
ncbi:MAG TPA: DUF2927 domain-containing protein [Paracoccaceae bacterium]|nr:DUF2927 domain-containing protein [Paracoccaceae bacterium]